jgi:hypothetical protein
MLRAHARLSAQERHKHFKQMWRIWHLCGTIV